jgi:hypothetical protein
MTGFENKTLFVLQNWKSVGYTTVCMIGEWGMIYQRLRVYSKTRNNLGLCASAKSTYKKQKLSSQSWKT